MAVKFWSTFADATKDLGGTHFTENEPLVSGGQRRWPNIIQTATIHDTSQGDVKMRKEDCYGWRVSPA